MIATVKHATTMISTVKHATTVIATVIVCSNSDSNSDSNSEACNNIDRQWMPSQTVRTICKTQLVPVVLGKIVRSRERVDAL